MPQIENQHHGFTSIATVQPVHERVVKQHHAPFAPWLILLPHTQPALRGSLQHKLCLQRGVALALKRGRARARRKHAEVNVPQPAQAHRELLQELDRMRAKRTGLVLPSTCLLYTSPSPRDRTRSRMPSSA
eukprot:TRINITY_DN12115_c0_g1_i3.p1 TRINITY_DN12115_c0_g1~~TRINITY_DN12115_c0_g1_i3.p1  ORF type:complete len:131 (+),score=21.86 TRINITY_DN12115_c0_g1_i3:193-585(+)